MNNKEKECRKSGRTAVRFCNHRYRASSFLRFSVSCLRTAGKLLRYPGVLGPTPKGAGTECDVKPISY